MFTSILQRIKLKQNRIFNYRSCYLVNCALAQFHKSQFDARNFNPSTIDEKRKRKYHTYV